MLKLCDENKESIKFSYIHNFNIMIYFLYNILERRSQMDNNLDMICGLIIHMKNDITNLVLQKLLYFIQAHSLLTNHIEAFNNRMEARMYGPVVPEVYDNFKRN